MTANETKTVQQISIKQATMEANQNYMTQDIQEMKQDIKDIKALLIQSNDLYVSKKIVKYFIGLAISLTVVALAVYDHFHKVIK